MSRTTKLYRTLNFERQTLIEKKFKGGGLTEQEEKQLEELQQKCGEELDKTHPMPDANGLLPYMKEL